MKHTLERFIKHIALANVISSGLIMSYIMYELSLTKESMMTSLVNKVVDHTHHELKDFFVPVQNLLVTAAVQTKIQGYHTMDASDFDQLFIPVIQYFPHLSSMGIADDQGCEYDIIKDSLEGSGLIRIVDIEEKRMIDRFENWKGDNEQVDDICLISVSI